MKKMKNWNEKRLYRKLRLKLYHQCQDDKITLEEYKIQFKKLKEKYKK